jgi:hypothetical protein
MANDVSYVMREGKGLETPLDQLVSIRNGHDLLALHREQEQGDELTERMVTVLGPLAREGFFELRDDSLRQ